MTSGAPQGGSSLAVPALQSADNNQRRDNGTQTMHAGHEGVTDPENDLISGGQTETPDADVSRVITRSEASARSKLEGGTDLQDNDATNTDRDMITPQTDEADNYSLRDAARQLPDIDITNIDANENSSDNHISEAAIQFRDAKVNDVSLSSLWTRAKAGSCEFQEAIMNASPKLTGCTDGSSMTTLTVGEQLSNYPDVFSDKPGRTDLIQHTIRVTDDIPTYQAPFRIPENLREPVENELKLMLENGIIQYDSETTYNSPLIVVKKPTGGIRLVNDFKKLNAKSVNDQYPMRNASELLSRVAGARFVSRIDIQKFFWQIPIEKKQ